MPLFNKGMAEESIAYFNSSSINAALPRVLRKAQHDILGSLECL
jgi:hypothetical protein